MKSRKQPKTRWWDTATEEQRAAHRRATSAGMVEWNARRTPEDKDRARRLITDANVARMWTKRTPGYKFPKGHRAMGKTPEALALRSLNQVGKASVKKIMRDAVEDEPELLRDALIRGIMAEPPRSFPYIALCAAYLDGKPIDAEPQAQQIVDLSNLTRDELRMRVEMLAERLRAEQTQCSGPELSVIDVTPEGPITHSPVVEPELTVEEAQAQVAAAEAEVEVARKEYEQARRIADIAERAHRLSELYLK